MPEPQTTDTIFMVRPEHFASNPETIDENTFMKPQCQDPRLIGRERQWALYEFDQAVETLMDAGIRVLVLPTPECEFVPDAVFPNNWVSFHVDDAGRMRALLYPMLSSLRRRERQWLRLAGTLQVHDLWNGEPILDASFLDWERRSAALEGTGSLVLSRPHRVAFVAYSQRTHPVLVSDWGKAMGYGVVPFFPIAIEGHRIYHTNVLMAIGQRFAVICPEAIDERANCLTREQVMEQLRSLELDVIEISRDQMEISFCGNILELRGTKGDPKIVMSQTAFEAYAAAGQLERLERYGELVVAHIPTIERVGGGSLRCMIAEVFHPGLIEPEVCFHPSLESEADVANSQALSDAVTETSNAA